MLPPHAPRRADRGTRGKEEEGVGWRGGGFRRRRRGGGDRVVERAPPCGSHRLPLFFPPRPARRGVSGGPHGGGGSELGGRSSDRGATSGGRRTHPPAPRPLLLPTAYRAGWSPSNTPTTGKPTALAHPSTLLHTPRSTPPAPHPQTAPAVHTRASSRHCPASVVASTAARAREGDGRSEGGEYRGGGGEGWAGFGTVVENRRPPGW